MHGKTLGFALIALLSVGMLPPARAEEKATAVNVSSPPRPGRFLQRWLLLGPLPVFQGEAKPDDLEAQVKAFSRDERAMIGIEGDAAPRAGQKAKVAGKEAEWRRWDSPEDTVDLIPALGSESFASAYAWAEIDAPKSGPALLGIGSDDAVRVWLNGQAVHDNFTMRGVVPDEDLVPVTFREGKNTLLLKVMNGQGGWGFSARVMDPAAINERLASAAAQGDPETVRALLSHGADPNAKGTQGLTALQHARISGYEEIARTLAGHGAKDSSLPSVAQVVDATMTEATRGESSGAAILLARDGKILLEKGYGYADIGNRVPITPKTKFRIGSVTKQFTAASILALMESGKLRLDDKLSKFYPDFPRGDEVTIRHLLNHTSGIHSYTSQPDFESRAVTPIKMDELIEEIKKFPYDFSPGEKWQYNNSGYFLLGAILEKVSGETYESFLRKRFFGPLGMKDTGVHRANDIIAHEATGYTYAGGKLQKALNWNMEWAGGAGALYSTVGDLYRWNEAVFGGKALKPETLKQAFSPVSTEGEPKPSVEEGYGFGWSIGRSRGLSTVSHGGGLHGFVSMLERYPEQNVTMVVLANAAPPPPGLEPGSLARNVAEFLLWKEMKPRETLAADPNVKPQDLDALAGEYDFGVMRVGVKRVGDRLFASPAGQAMIALTPRSSREFFNRRADLRLKFEEVENGEAKRLQVTQGDSKMSGTRAKETPAVKVDSSLLEAYVGKYEYGPGMVLTVTRKGDRLLEGV
ncbi:MAG: serine hydrolase [Armatimonadetes bacterium]|nr:serine hydrolase [Armatimonadota bacterium]